MASISPPCPASCWRTRRTATVTTEQPLATMLACITAREGYLPLPVIRRLEKLLPPMIRGLSAVDGETAPAASGSPLVGKAVVVKTEKG